MGAETTIMYLFAPGDHLLVSNDVYGGTYRLFERVLAPYGLQFDYIDMSNPESVCAQMKPNTKGVWVETPSNPLMKLIDLKAVSAIAKERGAKVIVDNTFASPYGQQPLKLGADIVVHSSTKYLGGHSDAVGGLVVTSDEAVYEKLKYLQNAVGAVPGPMDCFLVLRGVKHWASGCALTKRTRCGSPLSWKDIPPWSAWHIPACLLTLNMSLLRGR